MSEDLFTPDTVTVDQLVGEGKKFKTADDLAKSKVHADLHIGNLEKELSELRAELQGRLAMEQLLEKIQKPAPTPPADQKIVEPQPRQDAGSQKDLAEEVRKLVEQERIKEKVSANLEKVRNELKNRFGADYNQKLETIAAELSVSKEFLTDMAKTSPTGFLKLVDSVAKPDKDKPIVPPAPGKNAAFVDQNVGVKNAEYYRQLRKSNPELYFSRKVQAEMHEQALKQGPSFYQN